MAAGAGARLHPQPNGDLYSMHSGARHLYSMDLVSNTNTHAARTRTGTHEAHGFAELERDFIRSRTAEALAVRRGHSGARRRSDGEAAPRFDYLVDDAVIHAVRLNVDHVRPGILASPDRHRVPHLVRRRVQSEHELCSLVYDLDLGRLHQCA